MSADSSGGCNGRRERPRGAGLGSGGPACISCHSTARAPPGGTGPPPAGPTEGDGSRCSWVGLEQKTPSPPPPPGPPGPAPEAALTARRHKGQSGGQREHFQHVQAERQVLRNEKQPKPRTKWGLELSVWSFLGEAASLQGYSRNREVTRGAAAGQGPPTHPRQRRDTHQGEAGGPGVASFLAPTPAVTASRGSPGLCPGGGPGGGQGGRAAPGAGRGRPSLPVFQAGTSSKAT